MLKRPPFLAPLTLYGHIYAKYDHIKKGGYWNCYTGLSADVTHAVLLSALHKIGECKGFGLNCQKNKVSTPQPPPPWKNTKSPLESVLILLNKSCQFSSSQRLP